MYMYVYCHYFIIYTADTYISVYPANHTSATVNYGDSINISFIFESLSEDFQLVLNERLVTSFLQVDPDNDQLYHHSITARLGSEGNYTLWRNIEARKHACVH